MINELKNKFKNEIISLKKQYNTEILTEMEVDLIIEEELIKNFEKYYSNYFGRKIFLENIWLKVATSYQQKLNKNKKELNILLIEILLEKNKSLPPKQQLYILSEFLIYNNIELTQNFMEKLLDKNFILTKTIKEYINAQLKRTKIINIYELMLPNNLLNLIKEYCLKNNIKITDPVLNLTKTLTKNANYMTNEVTIEELYTIYQIDISKKISFLEEKKLLIETKSGNKHAKELLIKNNIYLVINVAFKYANNFTELQDLIQVGNIALLKSIVEYQFNGGYGFKRFFTQKIEEAIEKYLYETKSLIKITSYEEKKLNKLSKLTEKLINKLGRIPSDYELSAQLNVSIEEVIKLKNIEKINIRLEDYLEEYDITDYPDFTTTIIEEKVINYSLKKDIQKLLERSHLTDREKEIIYLKYGFKTNKELSFKEVAEILGITKAAANIFEKNALKKLRSLNLTKLSGYIEN